MSVLLIADQGDHGRAVKSRAIEGAQRWGAFELESGATSDTIRSVANSQLLRILSNNQPMFHLIKGIQSELVRHSFMAATIFYLKRMRGVASPDLLEIGSWIGSSVFTWSQALTQGGGKGSITCIDPWAPYLDVGRNKGDTYTIMEDALALGLPYELFLHNTSYVPPEIKVHHMRGRSSDMLPKLRESQFDLVYVDGEHRYESVLGDLRLSIPLLKPGGILCGDDLDLEAEECDLDFAFKNKDADCVTDPKSSRTFHPGVTLAVQEVLGPVSNYVGFWVVQRAEEGWQKVDLTDLPVMIPSHIPEKYRARIMEIFQGLGLARPVSNPRP